MACHRTAPALLVAVVSASVLSASSGCERRPRSTPITVGSTTRGALEQGDWTDVFADGSYTDLYELGLRSGQRVTIDLRSSDFDAYLSVMRGPGDQLVDNDDVESGNTDSRIVFESPADARYFVAVTTFRSGASGAYTLSVRDGGEAPPEGGAPAPPAETKVR